MPVARNPHAVAETAIADHVRELLRQREIQALRLMTWVRLAIVCIMSPLAWVLSQYAFDRIASVLLLGVYAIVTLYFAYRLKQDQGMGAAGLAGALFDVIMLGTLLWIWYTTMEGADVPPGLLLKSSLTELSLFFIVLNTMTLRVMYPLIVTFGALIIHGSLVLMTLLDGRGEFTASYLRGYTTEEIAGGRVTTGMTIVLLSGLVLTLLAWQARRMILEAAELQKNNDQLSRYFSPSLVEKLTQKPELFVVGGERREMSFLFTDLEGFTRMVERGDPAKVMAAINGYLEVMIQTAYRHDGTVDKVVGDAVRVFFGAPVEQPDHADRAVACALEMQTTAAAFRATVAEDLGFGRTRIGVNSGAVMVGNFGGESLFDYTAHGDAINVASRLESANKVFGTDILVSESTVSRCKAFSGRPVGQLQLRGISKPVQAFQPLAAAEMASEQVLAYREAYRAMEQETSDAADDFTALNERSPDDSLIRFYQQRALAGVSGVLVTID